jgi:hypothetical protein
MKSYKRFGDGNSLKFWYCIDCGEPELTHKTHKHDHGYNPI